MGTNEKRRRRFVKSLAIVVVLIVGLAYGYIYYAAQLEAQGRVRVEFVGADGASSRFNLAVADDAGERQKGLMYKKPGDLEENEGMLFVFPSETIQTFHMKDTYISLDMIFVNSEREVVGILDNVPVLNSEPRRVDQPSRYVIELLAGTSAKHGIETGDRVEFLDSLT